VPALVAEAGFEIEDGDEYPLIMRGYVVRQDEMVVGGALNLKLPGDSAELAQQWRTSRQPAASTISRR